MRKNFFASLVKIFITDLQKSCFCLIFFSFLLTAKTDNYIIILGNCAEWKGTKKRNYEI